MSSVALTVIVFSLLNSRSPCNLNVCSLVDCESPCFQDAKNIVWKLGGSLENEILCDLQATLAKPLSLCEENRNANAEAISLHNAEVLTSKD